MGYQVIVLTSRPIDLYPTLYEDTVQWLNANGIQYTRVWWGTDKAKKLADTGILEKVVFAVDDDARFIYQYAHAGVRSYWLRPGMVGIDGPQENLVRSFKDIIQLERKTYGHAD
jgi:hypothetical protein